MSKAKLDKLYQERMTLAISYARDFGFVAFDECVSEKSKSFLDRMGLSIHDSKLRDNWPGTQVFGFNRRVFKCQVWEDVPKIVFEFAPRFSDWTAEFFEDPFLLDCYGKVLFGSVTHEGDMFTETGLW